MNIKTVIDYLNKQQGYNLDSEYYTRISQWRDWWQGYHLPFHQFKEQGSDGAIRNRDMYTLKMAKKVCEDWASILLNEKTQIVIDDEASTEFVQGLDGTGGVFAQNDFWVRANALIEKAFYSGTGRGCAEGQSDADPAGISASYEYYPSNCQAGAHR